ncbi:MAG: ABC transporter substrate-binding protein [Sporichthyaceae bacterium]
MISACGSSGAAPVAAPAPAPMAEASTADSTAKLVEAVAAYLSAQAEPKKDPKLDTLARKALRAALKDADSRRAETAKVNPVKQSSGVTAIRENGEAKPAASPEARAQSKSRFEETGGATDTGVTRDSIKLGSISMHGMALSAFVVKPVVRANLATITSINERGGILGRRLKLVDCDDGPGEVSRAKACLKKLVNQDKIFSLVSSIDWASASLHDDLAQAKLPYVGSWAYSQTEWQDPYMFPTHMSMIHEAMAGANWVRDVIKPKTYGLLCLTSPEMQLACKQVQTILDASGAKLVKKVDVAISETSMSSQVLAMRAANPEHIVHYVVNAATLIKFMVESRQQNYYPPRGVSGNHLVAEALGSFIGDWPAGRYWNNTTYKLWGPEFMSVMAKYARGNSGMNHHIVQAAYVGMNLFAQAAKQVGPNLTRERLLAALGNGTVWKTDASLDQRFSYTPAERGGNFGNQTWAKDMGQGREFMYKYTGSNTVSKPDGSPNGWAPDPDKFVIHTRD